MAQILIRRLEDDLMANMKKRAKANGRSAEAEAREALRRAFGAAITNPRPLSELMGAGSKWGRSKEEIDAYIRALRDETF